jgi:hypothetical protein
VKTNNRLKTVYDKSRLPKTVDQCINLAVVEEPPPITKLDIVDAFVDTAFGSDFNAYYSASLPSSFDVSTIPPPAFSEEDMSSSPLFGDSSESEVSDRPRKVSI